MSISKHKMKLYKCILFLVALMPRLYFCLRSLPFRLLPDEFGAIGFPLYLAGKDYSHIISENIGYYGAGFTVIFTPVFLCVDSPIIQYRIILVICMLLQSLIVLIAFYLADEFLPNSNLWVKSLLALAASFFVQLRATYSNEHALCFLCWMITLFLYFLIKSRKDRYKWHIYSASVMVIICYSLTVHTRAIAIFLSLIIVVLLYWIIERDWFISPRAIIVVGGLGYYCSRWFIKYVQSTIWQSERGDFLGNTSVLSEVMLKISRITNPKEWPIFGNILIGQIETITVFSGGIFLFLIVAGFIMFKEMISSKKNSDKALWISFFFLICIFGTVLTQGITWLPDPIYGMGENDYRVKAITYIRYIMPYCGPFFLIIFCQLLQPKRQLMKIVRSSIFVYLFVEVSFIIFIVPYLYGLTTNHNILEVFKPFLFSKFKSVSALTFIPGILVSSVCYILAIVLAEKKALQYVLIPVTTVLLYCYIFNSIEVDLFYQKLDYQIADGGYSAINKLEETIALPSKLYLQNEIESDHNTAQFEYQFLLQKHEIVNSLPDRDAEAVVLSDVLPNSKEFYNMIIKGYRAAMLDENEILFVRGDNLIKAIVDSGLPLYDNFYEWIDISDRGMTENAVLDDNGNICSTGTEGYIIDGQSVSVIPGEVEVQLDLFVAQTKATKVGIVDIYNATTGRVLTAEDIIVDGQEDGEVHISLSSACCGNDKLCFRIYVNEGCLISVNSIQYVHSNNIYNIGADRDDEFAEMTDFIKKMYGNETIKFLINPLETKSQLSDKFLKGLIGDSFSGLCNGLDISISKPLILITAYDNWDLIWDLLEQYTIVYRTGNYSVLVKNDIANKENVAKSGGEILSEGHRIRVQYMQMNRQGLKTDWRKVILPFGTYDISAEYNSKANEEIGLFSYKCGGVFASEVPFEYEDGVWRAKDSAWVLYNETAISYEIMIKKIGDWKDVDVFFERTEPIVGIDLNLMEVEEAEIGEDGYIYSSGKKGKVMEGPFLPFGKGDYTLHIVIEDFSNLPSDAIQLTVRSDGNQVTRDRILSSSLEGKEGVELTLPFNLTKDSENITVEIQETQGTEIRINSVYFSSN